MAKDRTIEISQKIEKIFGGNIPDLDRLVELDTSIWKLKMLKGNQVSYEQQVFYKTKNIFGYSKKVCDTLYVSIDDEMSERIIDLFEEEYEKQAKKLEDLITKLEDKQ